MNTRYPGIWSLEVLTIWDEGEKSSLVGRGRSGCDQREALARCVCVFPASLQFHCPMHHPGPGRGSKSLQLHCKSWYLSLFLQRLTLSYFGPKLLWLLFGTSLQSHRPFGLGFPISFLPSFIAPCHCPALWWPPCHLRGLDSSPLYRDFLGCSIIFPGLAPTRF